MMKKELLALLLAIVTVVSVTPVASFSVGAQTVESAAEETLSASVQPVGQEIAAADEADSSVGAETTASADTPDAVPEAELTATDADTDDEVQTKAADGGGVYFVDPKPITIKNPDGTKQDLLPEKVPLHGGTGITLVYKIDGVDADKTIIADDVYVKLWGLDSNGNDGLRGQSWQWGLPAESNDGKAPSVLDMKNGYYYFYINSRLNGMNGVYTASAVSEFSIFNSHATHFYDEHNKRDPLNNNSNATFTMLAVIQDNLQPTVTFHGEDGELIAEPIKYEYTNVNVVQGTNNSNNVQRGALKTPNEVYALLDEHPTLPAKEPEGETYYVFDYWGDEAGNRIDYIYEDVDLFPYYKTASGETEYTVTFLDDDGTTIKQLSANQGKLDGEVPQVPNLSKHDGVYAYTFKGWTVQGSDGTLVNPATYVYVDDVTFVASYDKYGIVYEKPTTQTINNPAAKQNFLQEKVALHGGTGITLVYKIDGVDADKTIIADDVYVKMWGLDSNGNDGLRGQSWQWGSPADSNDGKAPSVLDLKNGYYYFYINSRLNGMNGVYTASAVSEFSIFNSHATHFYDENNQREPKNENSNATFTMLAVIQDNLQPTVTFHGEDGEPIAEPVKYEYTNVNVVQGTSNSNNVQRGALKTPNEVFALLKDVSKPEKPADVQYTYTFKCWGDRKGNPVEAIYTNCDLYPIFDKTPNTYTVSYTDDKSESEPKTTQETYTSEDENVQVADGTMTVTLKTLDDIMNDDEETVKYEFGGWEFTDQAPVGCTLSEDGQTLTINSDFKKGTEIHLTALWYVPDEAVQKMVQVDVKTDPPTQGEQDGKYTNAFRFGWDSTGGDGAEFKYQEDLKNAKILAFGFVYADGSFTADQVKDEIAKQNYEVDNGDYEWKNRQPSTVLQNSPKGVYYYVAGRDFSFDAYIASNINFTMKDIPKNEERYVMAFVTLRINGKIYVVTAETSTQLMPDNV